MRKIFLLKGGFLCLFCVLATIAGAKTTSGAFAISELSDEEDEDDETTEVITYSPADGETYASVSEIVVKTTNDIQCNEIDNVLGDIVVTDESGNSVVVVGYEIITAPGAYEGFDYDCGVKFSLEQEIVKAGTYTYTIPDSIMYWRGLTRNYIYNEEKTISFLIDGSLDNSDDEDVSGINGVTLQATADDKIYNL
ncbi:MAG: hypothetical protein LUC91_01590, partial [Prevotella sp.]|nr:hypothetical protein [Prevotella sp.]